MRNGRFVWGETIISSMLWRVLAASIALQTLSFAGTPQGKILRDREGMVTA